jgi:hypothetical protein
MSRLDEPAAVIDIRFPQRFLRLTSRNEYFAGLAFLCCANGIVARMIDYAHQMGWINASLATFEISMIVWLACAAGLWLVGLEGGGEIQPLDLALGAALLVPIALPIGSLSWLALTVLGLYLIAVSASGSARRRGAIILLAVTIPMFWSKLLFKYFANFILEIDATLVGLLLRTRHLGNLVRFADNSGDLVILPYCSSLANVSLALLAWISISQWFGHRWSIRDWQWCFLAAASVVAVNVTRMGLMGLSDTHYRSIHSQWGDSITGAIILFVTVGICLAGVRRELLVRA